MAQGSNAPADVAAEKGKKDEKKKMTKEERKREEEMVGSRLPRVLRIFGISANSDSDPGGR